MSCCIHGKDLDRCFLCERERVLEVRAEKAEAELAALKVAAQAVLDRARTHVLGDGTYCCKTCPSAVLRGLITTSAPPAKEKP